MKNIILIAAMAATITANAQTDSTVQSKPCESRITTSIDKFTDESSTYLTDPIVTPTGNIIAMIGSKNTFVFSIYGIDKGCIDEGAECIFLFEDGTKMTIYANSSFNCSGRCPIFVGGIFKNRTFYYAISKYKISAIRVKTRNGPAQIDLNPEQSDDLIEGIKCLNYIY